MAIPMSSIWVVLSSLVICSVGFSLIATPVTSSRPTLPFNGRILDHGYKQAGSNPAGERARHVALFVLGDSLFDPGNNRYLKSSNSRSSARTGMGAELSWPYGETYFRQPTGRICDGRVVPDFIAEFFKLPVWKAYLQPGEHNLTHGANFASGGAGVLSETHPGTVVSLRTQLSYFKDAVETLKKQIGVGETQKLLNRAVYLFSIGGNDYFSFYSSYPNASPYSKEQFVGNVNRNLTQVLEEIYNIGGRKIAFQNAGALGCVPSNIAKSADGKSCLEELSSLARMHNYGLSQSLKSLEQRLPGFKYSIFDYYHSIRDRVLHPTKYGFQNGKEPCFSGGMVPPGEKAGKVKLCKNPSKYVWFDGGHTTEACNWQLSQLIWKGDSDVASPYNLKQLYELN